MRQSSILIVDDNKNNRAVLSDALADRSNILRACTDFCVRGVYTVGFEVVSDCGIIAGYQNMAKP